MKRRLAAAILILLIVIGAGWALFQMSKSRTFQFFGELIPRVETSEKILALTFDDGPGRYHTDEILNILREEDVRATFYVTGAEIEKNPGEIEKIIAEGHEIGNHTYSHERMIAVSSAYVRNEIERTDELIRRSGWKYEVTFRPPYCRKLFALPWYLSQTGRKTVTWDVEPETYFQTSQELIAHTLENSRNGSIILLHVMYDNRSESMKAVRPIISGLRANGFQFHTVSDLLRRSGS